MACAGGLLPFLLLWTSLSSAAVPIRNVIVCIGDGMGSGQVAAAHCYLGTNLIFEGFPHQRLIATLAAGDVITDSAAAATAIATGRKVNCDVISLALPGDASELETLLECFKAEGKQTGLVTSSYLTDATPAAFGAHAYSRSWLPLIASNYLHRTRPEVLLGGGSDGLDGAAAAAAGYTVVTDAASLAAVDVSGAVRVCGLFGTGHLPYAHDGLGNLPSLSAMTVKALDILDNHPAGFFLMVEGGAIDIACHESDLPRCVGEVLAFDAAVREIVSWADGRDDTLILVVGDHETGGLSVTADNGPGVLPDVSWSAGGGHTAAPVALYGWGANAERVQDATDNTQLSCIARSRVPEPGEGLALARVDSACTVTRWAVASGEVYRVEHRPSLLSSPWQTCGTVTAQSARVSFAHSNGVPQAQGFYRMIRVGTAP